MGLSYRYRMLTRTVANRDRVDNWRIVVVTTTGCTSIDTESEIFPLCAGDLYPDHLDVRRGVSGEGDGIHDDHGTSGGDRTNLDCACCAGPIPTIRRRCPDNDLPHVHVLI